ncbi:MAG: hypothetical protein K8R57_10450 [Verrucomicrobia bacterium]|nr:hypothetical protein [Verrucomicrobiota bacterium]
MSLETTSWSTPLSGCDSYIAALNDYMTRSGQGHHRCVTMIEVGNGFSILALKSALARFGLNHPILGAQITRAYPGAVPRWKNTFTPEIEVQEHSQERDSHDLARELLATNWKGMMRFDVIAQADGAIILMSWSHLIFDGKGAELALAEISRLSSIAINPDSRTFLQSIPDVPAMGFRDKLKAVKPFIDRYWELRKEQVRSLCVDQREAGISDFRIIRFTSEESEIILQRAHDLTGGIFLLPYFLAVAMRAHKRVLADRGIHSGSLECSISLQKRKRGTNGPIFQNQVSQMFFSLKLEETDSLKTATSKLLDQYSSMAKTGFDAAFLIMTNWMRRIPLNLYRIFMRKEASGQITSFFHAHTGVFLSGVSAFCGGVIQDGCHVPSVSQPPGTGLFLSERDGLLTATLCWRDGVISTEEVETMQQMIRGDLLT